MGLYDILKRKKDNNKRTSDKNENKITKCKECNATFQDREHLVRHNKKAHGKKDDFMPTSNPFQP